jgi:hypothetical protein
LAARFPYPAKRDKRIFEVNRDLKNFLCQATEHGVIISQKGGVMEKKISVGMIVCSIFVILLGLSHFCLFSLFIFKRSLITHPFLLRYLLWLPPSIVYIASGIFLLRLKRWARLSIILITSIFIIEYVITLIPHNLSLIRTLVVHRSSNVDLSLIWSLLSFNILLGCALVGLLIYLAHPRVKEQFK